MVDVIQQKKEALEVDYKPLHESVNQALENYFNLLGEEEPADLYEIVLSEVELPLLKVIMKYTRNNQSKAAKLLGLSRGTLRKKLKKYGFCN